MSELNHTPVVYVGETNRVDDVARHDYLLSTMYGYLAFSSVNTEVRNVSLSFR